VEAALNTSVASKQKYEPIAARWCPWLENSKHAQLAKLHGLPEEIFLTNPGNWPFSLSDVGG
jgi:hypothetical protein